MLRRAGQIHRGPNPIFPLGRGYIDGVHIVNHTDADHDVQVQVGVCRDADDRRNLALESALVKQIDANWAAGDAAGGFPSGLTLSAQTWYHVFLIGGPSVAVDVGFDTSLTAANLLSDAGSEYPSYRRIGSVGTDVSSNIFGYTQDGDDFWLDATFLDVDSTNPGTSRVTAAISTPLGVRVEAFLEMQIDSTSHSGDPFAWVRPTDADDETPAHNNAANAHDGSLDDFSAGAIRCMTNTSSQISYRLASSSSNLDFSLRCLGWRDRRGKE